MSIHQEQSTRSSWRPEALFVFRAALLFLLLLTIPWNPGFYRKLFSFDLSHIQQVFEAGYSGLYFGSKTSTNFSGWIIALVLALAGALIWQRRDPSPVSAPDQLFYWVRVALRYRLAWAFVGSGLVLLLPFQLPAPTISDLHTAYGDFLPWKIYYHSTAVASAGYRQTLGFFELLGAVLLLYRRTAGLGALIISFLLGNIVLVNFAYDLGSQVYSSYLLLISLALLVYDFPRFYAILVSGTRALADRFQPVFSQSTARIRTVLKGAFFSAVLLLVGLALASYSNDRWPYPDAPGIPGAQGYYQVTSFSINDRDIPYSLTDSIRWRDVVFEQWNTLSVRSNRVYTGAEKRPQIGFQSNDNRDYEFLGNGGRSFYHYQQRTDSIILINPRNPADRYQFQLQRPDTANIVLKGINSQGDLLQVKLNRINKKYLLFTGRRKPVSIN